jgi:hypothetical protein
VGRSGKRGQIGAPQELSQYLLMAISLSGAEETNIQFLGEDAPVPAQKWPDRRLKSDRFFAFGLALIFPFGRGNILAFARSVLCV